MAVLKNLAAVQLPVKVQGKRYYRHHDRQFVIKRYASRPCRYRCITKCMVQGYDAGNVSLTFQAIFSGLLPQNYSKHRPCTGISSQRKNLGAVNRPPI